MRNIKKWDEFNIKYDENTKLYLEGKITINEWENDLYLLISENSLDNLKDKIVDKVLSILTTLKNKIINIGIKGLNILDRLYKFILKFIKSNPVLVKAIIVLIILFIFTIITVNAANNGQTIDKTLINAAIGMVERMSQHNDISLFDKMNVQGYLIDLKDNGKIDGLWNEHIRQIGDATIESLKKVQMDKNTWSKLVEFGESLTKYTQELIKTSGGSIYKINIGK